MKLIEWDELLGMMHSDVHGAIRSAVERFKATHVVLAENQDMCSSHHGERTVLCVGPENTYKHPEECLGKWLGDLPSQRQYFTHYAVVPESVSA